MKRRSEYDELLLKSFIRESFFQYKKDDLFENKKKNNIKRNKLLREYVELSEEIDQFLDELNEIIEESNKISSSKYSIKNILIESTELEITPNIKSAYEYAKSNEYIPPTITLEQYAKMYYSEVNKGEDRKGFFGWLKKSRQPIMLAAFVAVVAHKLIGAMNPGAGLDIAKKDYLEDIGQTGPGVVMQKVIKGGDGKPPVVGKDGKINAEELGKRAGLSPKVAKKLSFKIEKQADKKVKELKSDSPKVKETKAKKLVKDLKKNLDQKEKDVGEAPKIPDAKTPKVDSSDYKDKGMKKLEKEAEKLAKEKGDASISIQGQKILQSKMKKTARIAKVNVDKAKKDMSQGINGHYKTDTQKEKVNNFYKGMSTDDQQAVAQTMTKLVKSMMQDELRSGELGQQIKSASSQKGDVSVKLKLYDSNEGGESSVTYVDSDPLAAASNSANEVKLHGDGGASSPAKWGAKGSTLGFGGSKLGEQLQDDVQKQLNSPDVKQPIVSALKAAGVKNAEGEYEKAVDRVSSQSKFTFQGIIAKKANDKPCATDMGVKNQPNVIEAGGEFDMSSASASNQTVK